MAVHQIYRFYAELKDYTPKIWRRFEVIGTKTIAEFGYTIMTMFEMQASHLFCLCMIRAKRCLKTCEKALRIRN